MHGQKLSCVFYKPTPYHNTLLNYLSTKQNIHLTVYYLVKSTHHHPWQLTEGKYDSIFINTYGALCNAITHIIRNKPDLVIVAGLFNPNCLLFYLLFKIWDVRFATWGDVLRLNKPRGYLKKTMRVIFLRWIYQNAAAIFTMGQVGLDAYTTMGFPSKKLGNLPLIVDPDDSLTLNDDIIKSATEIQRQFAQNGEIIFVGAAMLVAPKKYDLAIQAFHEALLHSSNQKAVMLIAGEGPERSNLQDLALRLGLGDKVHFLGWRQPQEMKSLYHAADVFIHPSAWDAYGAVILEAMVWGLPVLASDQTMAAVDRVVPGENGFIHEVGDTAALSAQIQYFLDDPARISFMGAKARATAEQWPVSRCVQPILDSL